MNHFFGRCLNQFLSTCHMPCCMQNPCALSSKGVCKVFGKDKGHETFVELSKSIKLNEMLYTQSWFLLFAPLEVEVLIPQSRLTLCNPRDSVHGILQARILELVAISFFRRSSWPRDQTRVSCIAGRFFTTEPPGKPTLFVPLNILSSHCHTELVNPELLPLEKYRVGFLPASGYILFTHSCVTLFYMCLCLETPYLVYVADWSSQPSALWLTSEQSSSNTRFLHNAHHRLLCLEH